MKAVAKTVEPAEREARSTISPHYLEALTFGRAPPPASARRHQGRVRSPRARRHQCGAGAAPLQSATRSSQPATAARAATTSAPMSPTISRSWSRWVSSITSARASPPFGTHRASPPTRAARCANIVEALYHKHVRTVEQVGGINADEFGVLNKALHRLERFWTDHFLYRLLTRAGRARQGSILAGEFSKPRRRCRGLVAGRAHATVAMSASLVGSRGSDAVFRDSSSRCSIWWMTCGRMVPDGGKRPPA